MLRIRKVLGNLKIKVISPTGNSTGNGLLHSAVSNIKLAQYHTVKAMGTTYRELYKIHDLIQSGDVRSVDQFLTEHQVNVNEILQCKGIALLHLAVGVEPVEKSKECTELLLKHGADPNLCNEDGITPVHIAAIWGRVDNLKLLIGCGGDPGCKDLDGLSAFDYAAREQQWEVYDYLHNVEDQIEDTLGSPCAYTLDLERILVTTDQMVAEYEPIHNDKTWSSTCRKSEMVRDWCEKTSLVVNKLYPTIISDCITSDNDPPAWRSINYTKNTNLDLTADKASNDSNLNETFKTCLSKPIEISGIQPLQITSDESKVSKSTLSSKPQTQRYSIYKNFSLPGSPSNITHKNYNSKTNLRKQSQIDSLGSELKILAIDSGQSLLTEESTRSVDLDKAMAVAQNRTNEWLSSSSRSSDGQATNNHACNTRRSSASSGVSSNLSSGSIVLANIEEEYKYEDKVEDVILIEKHLLVSSVILAVDDGANSPDETVISIASSLPPSMEYDTETLRKELQQLGFNPGPIQNSNRTLYLKKLQTLKKNPIVVSNQGKTYSVELEKSLRTNDWMTNLSPYMELETRARSDFANPSKKWREGLAKTSFTYLLLDPRVTANLPSKATHQTPHESWVTFVNSIFYVGKGKRSRPYSHLYQALTLWKRDFTTSKDKKVQHILDIWSDKVGVVCLHIFQNVIPAEAYTYEASMIDVLGLQNLKNLKCGNYYGAVSSWPLKERRMLGLYLLYKAMLIFLSEGERQLRPDDID